MSLKEVKILDLTRLLPFEFGSMILADSGAEVLKIEEPGKGDYMRWMGPKCKEESYIFLLTNRNKKSMTLNLRLQEGRDILLQLTREYDVIFESFRPGVADKLGIGYDAVKKQNPRIVYCSGSGYGQYGPYRNRPGHDINCISTSGILEATGRHLGHPVIPGIPISDMSVGIFCAYAILAALLAREQTGTGQFVDVCMSDIMVAYNTYHAAYLFAKQKEDETLSITGGAPYYESFRTKDHKFISFGNIEKKFWDNFCEAIGREDIKKDQFCTGERKERIMKELRDMFLAKTRDEWLDVLEGKDICYSPVNTIEEVFMDKHILDRGMLLSVDHPKEGKIQQIGFPIKFSNTPCTMRFPPPVLGQHTNEVLTNLGYGESELARFRKSKVI
jgi:crotonobetainyl-CoA:carnitine CoA-transferase CaiB-like acyl-CoA transferase